MEKAVKIKQYLLKEEETMTGTHVIKGAKILENSSRAERQRILTDYKDLFSTNCEADNGEACCYGDDYLESMHEKQRKDMT